MYPALLGAAVNLILDPILIFTLGLGIEGAAMATVAARLATVVVAIGLAMSRYRAFAWPRPHRVVRDFSDAMGIAVPAVLATVATPMGTAIVMREMAKYGTDAVAAMAVINRMVPVVFAVVLSMSGAIGPIFGQNFGAGRMDRVQETFVEGLRFLAIYVLGMSALLYLLRAPIADVFNADGQMRDLLFLFLGPVALASFFNGRSSWPTRRSTISGVPDTRPGSAGRAILPEHCRSCWPSGRSGAHRAFLSVRLSGGLCSPVSRSGWRCASSRSRAAIRCRGSISAPTAGCMSCPTARCGNTVSPVRPTTPRWTSRRWGADDQPLSVDRPPLSIRADDRHPANRRQTTPPKKTPGWVLPMRSR